jgi:hypothetical protein
MPQQRFRCPRCGLVDTFWYAAPAYDADHNRLSPWPRCPACLLDDVLMASDAELPPELEPFPCNLNHDLLTGGTGLTVLSSTCDAEVTVSSLSEIRTIENESLRRARNGDGAPLVFRGFSQDRSNRHQNTLRGSEFEKNRSVKIERPTTVRGLPIRPRAISESETPK